MKLNPFRSVIFSMLALLVGGCSTAPEKDDQAMGEGAPVVSTDDQMTGPGGAQITGAREGGVWTGSELDNPDSLLYEKVIYFDYDSSEVRADFVDIVAAHGAYLAANPSVTMTIEGHCDERGSREYNIGLGERRSNAVKRLLLAQGVAESQIITISYGEERPVDLSSTETGWAQNRRAELIY